MGVKVILTALLLLSGCSDRGPDPRTSSEPSSPSPVPATSAPGASATGTATSGAKGDLSIVSSGQCLIQTDSENALWLKVIVSARWLGTTPFPATEYSVSTDPAGKPASGAVTSSDPFTVAVGGEPIDGNAFLDRKVILAIKIDPENRVAELNEANNVAIVAINVPGTVPQDNAEHILPCTTG